MLRGILRERFRRVQREIGVPEGLIESVTPLPALDVKVEFAWPPWLPTPTLPFNIAWGKASGPQAGVWYLVTFSYVGSDPQVVAVAEVQPVTFLTRTVDKVSITKVGVHCLHCRSCDMGFFAVRVTNCPSCGSSNIEELTGSDRYEKTGWYLALWNAKRQLGDWTAAFNWMRDAIANLIAWIGYYLLGGNGAFVMAEVLSLQVDEVQSSLNATVDRLVDAVNARLSDLYQMWGIPGNLRIVPAQIRNVTSTSFEFLSLGNTTIHFMAIGKTG